MSKNTRTRILLTAVAALLLVAMTVGGTLAWLQDTSDTVKNTFTPSNIDVSIKEDGATDNDGDKVHEQSFQFVPSVHLDKEPVVSASADVPYFVFVEVVIENWPNLGTDTDGRNLIEYTLNTIDNGGVWSVLTDNTTNGSGTVVLYQELEANEALTNSPVLQAAYGDDEEIYVSRELTKEDMAKITSYPTMTFTSYAMQKQIADSEFSPEAAYGTVNPN